jgi:dTDP-4-amino-4,6-dideoxygalactose transaminase
MTSLKLWLSSPHMGSKELEYINEAFETNWIAPLGPNVNGFETDLETFLNHGVHVAALSAGTAALHLALILLGVGREDEVICQSFTFSASANPIVYQGALPIFVDSESETWNMSPRWLRIAIEDRINKGKVPRAIIPVHLYGMPAKMDEIMTIGEEFNIPVVEDAAEALGANYKGIPCGTFGKISILSFNGNKIITTSGGGAIVSKEIELVNQARFLATQARDPAPHYEHSNIGYNYRMSNISAGIGRGQMEVLLERISKRRANYDYYLANLGQVPGISFLPEPVDCYSNRWLTTIQVDPEKSGGVTREDIRLALEEDNIETRPLWKPMHLQPIFKSAPFYGDGTSDRLFEHGLCLPSGSNMTNQDQDRVIEQIKKIKI